MISVKNFRPLDNDVALIRCDQEKIYNYAVLVADNNELQDYQYYEVVAKGNNVKNVDVGDTVLMSWARMTPPIDFHEGKVALTDQKEIVGVIEK